MRNLSILFLFFILLDQPAVAQQRHTVLRRLAVLPLFSESLDSKSSEAIWWKIRDEITRNRRILIASKQFLIRKKIFYPRSKVERSDAILLGRLLEADGIMTANITSRSFTLTVFDGNTGALLWRQSKAILSSRSRSKQAESLALSLTRDFLASIPYHGFVIVDPLIGTAVFQEGRTKQVKVDVISKGTIEIGQSIQWIEVLGESPLFQGGGKIRVLAEGLVTKTDGDILTIKIQRAKRLKDLKERSLIRIPLEAVRFRRTFALQDPTQLSPELLRAELAPPPAENEESVKTATTLSAIIAIAGFVLLAL